MWIIAPHATIRLTHVLPRLDHGYYPATLGGLQKDHQASRRPLLQRLIGSRLTKAATRHYVGKSLGKNFNLTAHFLLPSRPGKERQSSSRYAEVSLIKQRTAFINQLRHGSPEYYPAALEVFENWTSVSAWVFLQRFPSPESLAQADRGRG